MKDDLNTVTLSGTLSLDPETYTMVDMPVTHLRVIVHGAGPNGAGNATLHVIAYDKVAEHAREFRSGDRVVLTGPLRQSRDRWTQALSTEIEAKVLIKMRPHLLEHAAKE